MRNIGLCAIVSILASCSTPKQEPKPDYIFNEDGRYSVFRNIGDGYRIMATVSNLGSAYRFANQTARLWRMKFEPEDAAKYDTDNDHIISDTEFYRALRDKYQAKGFRYRSGTGFELTR